jgi:excisionase family DNA binding protein
MSGTSVTGLLDRADTICAEFRASQDRVSAEDWQIFDQTVYRLLCELAGVRVGPDLVDLEALPLHRAVSEYPGPRVPQAETGTFSPREAARATGLSYSTIRRQIRDGALTATRDESGLRIPREELDLPQAVPAANAADPRPLHRLASVLGAVNDVLVIHRQDPRGLPFDTVSATTIAARVLHIAGQAGQHALAVCSPFDADRPLKLARYAKEAGLNLSDYFPAQPPHDPALPPPAQSLGTPAANLARALHDWTLAAYEEVRRDVPSVDVLKDVGRQGIHLYAATDSLLRGSIPAHALRVELTDHLRASAQRLQAGVEGWKASTTCAPPSHRYVGAARTLYLELTDLVRGTHPRPRAAELYETLRRGASDIAWVATMITPQASRLIDSQVLFAPARSLRPSAERLGAMTQRRLVPVRALDMADLVPVLIASELAARDMTTGLPNRLHECRADLDRSLTPSH